MYDKFIGKTVAVRGIGSGVNVGECVVIKDNNVLLSAGSYFCRSWEYTDSHGAFHSLSKADIVSGEITKTKGETILTDVAQVVICDDILINKIEKLAK